MFDSPIKIITDGMRTEIEGQILRAVQNVGVIVDKEELLKALQYDREQYSKGYKDGYLKAIEEFAEACKNHIFCQTFGLHPKTIDEIAEELKGEC